MAFGSLKILRSRDYALLWWSGLISDAGNWMQAVAIGALIVSLTDQALWGGLVAAASFLAMGLLMPLGGVAADKRDRRRLMIFGASVQGVVAVALAALYIADLITPVVLVVAVAIEGLMSAITMPARSAMYPDIVPKENLADASALGALSWNLGRTIGPSLAGLILLFGDYSWIFFINAVTFVAIAIAAAFVRSYPHPHSDDSSVLVRLKEGFSGARATAACWSASRMVAIIALTVSPFIALMPAVAQLVFDGDAVDTSHFVMAQGVGSVIGALLLAPATRRWGSFRVLVFVLIATPVVQIFFALSPTKWVAVAGALMLGWGYVSIFVALTTIVQLHAPTRLRGRILAIHMMTLSVFYPVGATVQGWLGDQIGIRMTLFGGAVVFLVAFGLMVLLRRTWLTALGTPALVEPEAVAKATPIEIEEKVEETVH